MLEHLQYPHALFALLALALLFYRPMWGLVLMAAIFPMNPWSPRLPVPGLNTETILIGVAFAVTVLRFGTRLPPLRDSAPVIAFVAVMFVAFAIAIPWARTLTAPGGESAVWWIFKIWKSIIFTALLFFSAYWWFPTPQDRQRMLQALCVGLFFSSVAGILDFAIGVNPARIEGRASGFVGDPNAMAESIGSMMFVPLYLLMRGRDLRLPWRAFAVVSYGLGALAVVFSLSRGNWIAFLAAHAVFVMLVDRRLLVGAVAAVAVVLTVGFPFLPEMVRDRIAFTTQTSSVVYQVPLALNVESSTATRIVFARIGLDMFEQSPIWGHGLNAFNTRTPEFGAKYGVLQQKDSHSLVVKMATDAGLIGLGVLAWVVFAVFRCGRRLWRSRSSERLLGAMLLATATHVLVANLSANAFLYVGQISAQFWIVYALAARAYVERGAEQEAPAAAPVLPGRWRRFAQRTPAAVSHP